MHYNYHYYLKNPIVIVLKKKTTNPQPALSSFCAVTQKSLCAKSKSLLLHPHATSLHVAASMLRAGEGAFVSDFLVPRSWKGSWPKQKTLTQKGERVQEDEGTRSRLGALLAQGGKDGGEWLALPEGSHEHGWRKTQPAPGLCNEISIKFSTLQDFIWDNSFIFLRNFLLRESWSKPISSPALL